MKKVAFILLAAFALVVLVSSCEQETEQTYDQVQAIDKEEVEEDDI